MKKLILSTLFLKSIAVFAQQPQHIVMVKANICLAPNTNVTYKIFPKDSTVKDSIINKTKTITIADNSILDIKLPENDNILDGVSTYDLVLINKHILGTHPITNPYLLIAADVNNNGKISTSDIVELRQMILGWRTKFTNSGAFRDFCNVGTIAQINNNWTFQIKQDETINFVRVKVGDLNLNGCSGTLRTAQPLPIVMSDEYLQTGETYTFVLPMKDMAGIQGTIAYDTEALELTATDENSNQLVKGKISFVQLKDDAMQLTFRVKKNTVVSQAISLTSDQLTAEAYNEQLEGFTPILTFNNKIGKSQILSAKVFPNPAQQQSNIHISTVDDSEVIVNVFDALGKMVYTTQMTQQNGEISLPIYLPQQGCYSYQVIQSKQLVLGKLLIQ